MGLGPLIIKDLLAIDEVAEKGPLIEAMPEPPTVYIEPTLLRWSGNEPFSLPGNSKYSG